MIARRPILHKVPKYNYAAQFPAFEERLLPKIGQLVLGGSYVLGDEVSAFEAGLADFVGTDRCVGLNSGTDALIIGMVALGIGPGDEVVLPANTFYSTALAVVRVGATPVLVDCDAETFLMDQAEIAERITPSTRAIIPVHLFGRAMDLKEVRRLADRHDLWLIEDCAQALGALTPYGRVGALGTMGCHSFAPAKNLAAIGDGGALTTSDSELAEKVAVLRHLGQQVQNDHIALGFNSRLDSIPAAILNYKLPYLDKWNRLRQERAECYRRELARFPVSFQDPGADGQHVYHLFQVCSEERDRLLQGLIAAGVEAVVRYPVPIHLQPAFSSFGWSVGQFPTSELLALQSLCLPIRPDLTDDDIAHVVDVFSFVFE